MSVMILQLDNYICSQNIRFGSLKINSTIIFYSNLSVGGGGGGGGGGGLTVQERILYLLTYREN